MTSKLHEFALTLLEHFPGAISERSWRDFGSELNI